jgi:hypothetical protein
MIVSRQRNSDKNFNIDLGNKTLKMRQSSITYIWRQQYQIKIDSWNKWIQWMLTILFISEHFPLPRLSKILNIEMY